MQLLIVHGMARTPVSMWPMARHLTRFGHRVTSAGYISAWESFEAVCARVRSRLDALASGSEPYALIGHSLGGLILRAALGAKPAPASAPRRLVMLGTPNQPPRLARRYRRLWPYRIINGEAGQLLADPGFFAGLPPLDIPYTIIAGTGGSHGRLSRFKGELNDGTVAVSETLVTVGDEPVLVAARHTFIMNHPEARSAVRRVLDEAAGTLA